MTNSTETFFIRLYSTDARLSWDQFQCILMDIVTLSTDTNDCDLRHQCISEFDLHLCTWAQCCSGNGHNFFGTYSTLLYGQFHSYIFLWPIPALTFGVTYSTDASGPNSKLNFVTYSSTPSRPYSVPPQGQTSLGPVELVTMLHLWNWSHMFCTCGIGHKFFFSSCGIGHSF